MITPTEYRKAHGWDDGHWWDDHVQEYVLAVTGQVARKSYAKTNKKLYLCTLNPEWNKKTCDYWYTVEVECSTPHTAFNRRESLLQYLQERGLELTEPLPEHGTSSGQWLKGEYREEMHWSYDEFFALRGIRTRALSNGDYTLAIITTDEDGLRTVHTLNPNCHDRPVFNYFESRGLLG